MKYLHTGMIVGEKLPDMIYMEPLKVWVTDASKDKYSIEFLYFRTSMPPSKASPSSGTRWMWAAPTSPLSTTTTPSSSSTSPSSEVLPCR